MAKKCVRYKRTGAGRRCAQYSGYGKGKRKRRSYRGYGQSVRVFSGFGKMAAIPVDLPIILAPAVGVGASAGTALMLRAFVDPITKDKDGNIAMEDDGVTPKVHWAFKYAGLIGAGVGVGLSALLAAFGMGVGSAVIGGIGALGTGLASQFYNSVVPEKVGEGADMVERRKLYAWRGYGRSPYGLVALQPRGGGEATLMQPTGFMRGTRGYGMIGAEPSMARNFLVAGRGTQSMPANVLRQVNAAAWGGSAPVM